MGMLSGKEDRYQYGSRACATLFICTFTEKEKEKEKKKRGKNERAGGMVSKAVFCILAILHCDKYYISTNQVIPKSSRDRILALLNKL